MKKIFLVYGVLILLAGSAQARDFMVEYVQENYKEEQVRFSYSPLVYHSIQINSAAGPKVIILKGDDYTYRRWIRHYIAENKQFILRIKDDHNDLFMAAKAYELDIRSVHPVNSKKWSYPDVANGEPKVLSGSNYILVIDTNEKRSMLIKTIAEKMGFQVLMTTTGDQALTPFKLQPEKFAMVIAHHMIVGGPSGNLVDRFLKIDQRIPIIVDTGYRNERLKNTYISKYKKQPSVIIKPMILQELSKMIEQLTSGNV